MTERYEPMTELAQVELINACDTSGWHDLVSGLMATIRALQAELDELKRTMQPPTDGDGEATDGISTTPA
jgi:hypothetical protein